MISSSPSLRQMICKDLLIILLGIAYICQPCQNQSSFVQIQFQLLPTARAFTIPSARLRSHHLISNPGPSFLSSHKHHGEEEEQSFKTSHDVLVADLEPKQQRREKSSLERITEATANDNDNANTDQSSRRIFFSSILLTAAATVTPPNANAESITWRQSPINKRSGVSLTQAEQIYNIRFITYLSRLLLSFDEECQKWWYKRAGDIPRTATAEQVQTLRRKQFAMFAASVEVSLQEFDGDGSTKGRDDGPKELMQSLLKRYGQDWEDMQRERVEKGLPPLKSASEEKYKRDSREARRQIALLFSLLKTYQPVDSITKLLATLDNGKVERVEILNPGSGYAPGYEAPIVTFSAPDAGEDFEIAQGKAVLRPSGRILRVDVDADLEKRGGYSFGKPPLVTITPPLAAAIGSPFAKTATAKAFVVRDGVNKGKIERIDLIDPGLGYAEDETIMVTIAPPPVDPLKLNGNSTRTVQTCAAKAVIEYEVSKIEITNPGSGYATEKPFEVVVEPPPATARVNLNDPLFTKDLGLQKQIAKEAEEPVVAMAYYTAVSDSFTGFRTANDNKAKAFETSLLKQKISASGDETTMKSLPFWTGGVTTSSAQLLSLLPAGIGLIYNRDAKRYELVAGDEVLDYGWADAMSPGKPIDPDFGPRGRSPIEREKKLDTGTLLRFYLSGALCSSSVHLILTPIDVIKTNMQTKPEKYPGPFTSFKIVLEEKGPTGFFAGWVPTFIGFFINGGVSYTAIEFFRRYYTDILGDLAQNYEIPIILASSFTAAVIGVFTLTPSEAIRIRSVAQPDYAPNALGVTKRIIEEEGFGSLFNAVPAFMLKEIPFIIAKFTVFDLSTEYLYDKYPAALEDVKLSLLVSLAGGVLAGISAALVSNPADATISEMKKAKTDDGPLVIFQRLANEGGAKALFRGLGVRMVFYTLICSLQFLVYDAIRISLRVGNDDLKLYFDVLGTALTESGGPV